MTEKLLDMYRRIETEKQPERCPLCSSEADVWRYSETADGPTTVAVMCGNNEPLGDHDDGCVLYMPPDAFYAATIKEAIAYWNRYAKSAARSRADYAEREEG